MIESPGARALLLHGFTLTGGSWNGVIRALPAHWRTCAPDLRGHGRAGQSRPVSLEAVLGDVLRLAGAEEGPEQAPLVLVGYSMGGRLALHAALAAEMRLHHLVLIGASPGLADPREREARRAADERLADELERVTIEAFAARWGAQTAVLAGQPPEVARLARAERLRSTPEGLAAALRGLGTGALPSLWPRLGEVRVPVTLVVGERDDKFTAIASQMARRLPHAELAVVAGAGHAVHLEQPAAVARILAATVPDAPRSP